MGKGKIGLLGILRLLGLLGLVDHLVDVVVVDVNKEVLRRRRQRSGVGDGLDRHGEGGGAAMNGGMSFV